MPGPSDMPGYSMDDKPWGNSNSLVPEIRGMRGPSMKSPTAANQGRMPEPKMVCTVKNRSFTDLKGTGRD